MSLPTANNEENWATMQLLAIARTMEMDADSTLKDLPALAVSIMDELKTLRAEAAVPKVGSSATLQNFPAYAVAIIAEIQSLRTNVSTSPSP